MFSRPPIFILLFLLLTRFFSVFQKVIDELFVYVIPLGPLFHGLSGIQGARNKTSSYIAMIGLSSPRFLTAAQPPMSYGISSRRGSLIPSFCLSIKGRHDAPSLSRCSTGVKSDYGSLCYFLVQFSRHLPADVFP